MRISGHKTPEVFNRYNLNARLSSKIGTLQAHKRQSLKFNSVVEIRLSALESMVRMRGLEPPFPCGSQILSLVRLPVSPHPQLKLSVIITSANAPKLSQIG